MFPTAAVVVVNVVTTTVIAVFSKLNHKTWDYKYVPKEMKTKHYALA